MLIMLVLVPCDSFSHDPLAEPELMTSSLLTNQHSVLENFAANATYDHLQKVLLFDEILHFELNSSNGGHGG